MSPKTLIHPIEGRVNNHFEIVWWQYQLLTDINTQILSRVEVWGCDKSR